jgi:hypothetical protein
MIDKLGEFSLGDIGTRYVESCLRQGVGLCSKFHDLSHIGGESYTPLPDGVSSDRAKKFDTGGLLSKRTTEAWFVGRVQQLFRSNADGSLIFQDVWMNRTDGNARHSTTIKFLNESSVYYLLKGDDVDLYAVRAAMREIRSFLFVAFFSNYAISGSDLASDNSVSNNVMNDLAVGVREVFVSAYDQEGLVNWRKKSNGCLGS